MTRGCNNVEKGNIKETPSDASCELLQLREAPVVDMEQFDGNPLNYHYFMALLAEVVETNIEEPRERLARLLKGRSSIASSCHTRLSAYKSTSGKNLW